MTEFAGVDVGVADTWTQLRTEPHLLGRTMSFLMLGSVVAAPVSLAVAGPAVDLEATPSSSSEQASWSSGPLWPVSPRASRGGWFSRG